MHIYDIASIKDIDKDYMDATIYYQKSIDNNEKNIDAYLNLAFLYWNFQDYGFCSFYNISENLRNIGHEKHLEIIEEGLCKYPKSVELHFWLKYFQHLNIGEEFSELDCQELLKIFGDYESIVPYFFLNLFDKEKYNHKIMQLLIICNEMPTAKNNYIKSIIMD